MLYLCKAFLEWMHTLFLLTFPLESPPRKENEQIKTYIHVATLWRRLSLYIVVCGEPEWKMTGLRHFFIRLVRDVRKRITLVLTL